MRFYTPMERGKKIHNYKKLFFGAEKYNYNYIYISGTVVGIYIN